MAIAGGNIKLNSTEGMDKISQTEKVTSPYFSDGTTTLLGASIISSSLTDTNEKYFFGISNSSTPTTEVFNVAFGSTNGFGALVEANTKSETEAIYNQYASLLLAPTEVTGGFFISSPASDSSVSAGKDTEIFVLTARRSNMKDRINKGTWTVAFSGSVAAGTVADKLVLTDDSVNESPTATPVGDRYNIVSGSDGTVVSESTARNFGFFYPDVGVLVFSAAELSRSIQGNASNIGDVVYRYTEAPTGSYAVGQAGVNQVWNFSGVWQQSNVAPLLFIDPSGSPFELQYPNANLCLNDNGTYSYYNKTGAGLFLHGLGDTVFNSPALYSFRNGRRKPS